LTKIGKWHASQCTRCNYFCKGLAVSLGSWPLADFGVSTTTFATPDESFGRLQRFGWTVGDVAVTMSLNAADVWRRTNARKETRG
jgi:hypothetical protein